MTTFVTSDKGGKGASEMHKVMSKDTQSETVFGNAKPSLAVATPVDVVAKESNPFARTELANQSMINPFAGVKLGYENPMRKLKTGPARKASRAARKAVQPPRPEGEVTKESAQPTPVSGGETVDGKAELQAAAAVEAKTEPCVGAHQPSVGHRDVDLKETSWWVNVKDGFKRAVLTCFCMGDVVADWEADASFRREVAREMCSIVTADADKTVDETVVAEVHALNAQTVQHVPRLVAHVTVALRMKLGLGAMDRSVPGNVAVVRAEAAKALRELNVRTKQAAAHLLEVERCFFEDDTHYRVSTWRARACRSSWIVRRVLGESEPVRFDF